MNQNTDTAHDYSPHFANTASGANASAHVYSIIESAKANGLEPRQYIEHLLTELPKRKAGDDVKDLLPLGG